MRGSGDRGRDRKGGEGEIVARIGMKGDKERKEEVRRVWSWRIRKEREDCEFGIGMVLPLHRSSIRPIAFPPIG